MGLLDKANKRNCYPVALEDRTVYVRSMKSGEIKRMADLDPELKTGFVMGICLVDERGNPEVVPQANEADADFSARVSNLMDAADVDTETISKLSQAIGKIGKIDVETIQKN